MASSRAGSLPRPSRHRPRPGSRRDFVPHAAKFRSERTETVATTSSVAGPAGLLKLGGNLTNAMCPDCLCRAFQPMRRGCKLGEIARAVGRIDNAFRLRGAAAEFDEQRVNAGRIITEPCGQDISINGAAGSPAFRLHAGMA